MFGDSLFRTEAPAGLSLPLPRGTGSVDFCLGTPWVQSRHRELARGSAF